MFSFKFELFCIRLLLKALLVLELPELGIATTGFVVEPFDLHFGVLEGLVVPVAFGEKVDQHLVEHSRGDETVGVEVADVHG
jgi:hypothetical protein